MIQDIAPKKYNNAFHVKDPRDSDTILVFDKNRVLCQKIGEEVRYPMLAELGAKYGDCTFLFSIDEVDYFLLRTTDYCVPTNFGFENITVSYSVARRFGLCRLCCMAIIQLVQ